MIVFFEGRKEEEEMGFVINLHPSANPSIFPRSSSQVLRFSVQTKNPPRNFNLHPLTPPQSVVYLNSSFLESSSSSSTHVLQRFNLSCRNRSSDESSELHSESVLNPISRSSVDKSFRSAAWIGAATIASKILGLLREIILAAIFGVGPVVTAFKYASVLPGFCASLLGGVNGPIHITMATTLSKLPEKSGRRLIQNTISIMFLVGGVLGALVFIFAESIIYVSAPGLWILAEGQITREIAISQLKLMIPCIVFAGPVGLGFGCLSAEGDSIFACISPTLSSISIIASSITYVWMRGSNAFSPHDALIGGGVVSFGASLGAFLQWLIQVIKHGKLRHNFFSLSWLDLLKDEDVHKFFILMFPAILVSGMAQIASFTDLYFASFIPGAAAGLSYAHLLAMAPMGIISSITILPLVPTFSKLTKTSSWPILTENLKKAILLCMVIVLPIKMTMCVLAKPVVSVLFQRFTFSSAATSLISSLLFCYSIGSPFSVIRELLVMVFYALGDGQQPFLISVAAIILNAFLDWLFVSRFFLGAQGLALATSFCTALSVLLLLHLLSKKLTGLIDFTEAVGPLLQLLACCIISGTTTSVSYMVLQYLLSSVTIPRYFRLMEFLSISLAGSLGLCGFFFPLVFLHFTGSNLRATVDNASLTDLLLTPVSIQIFVLHSNYAHSYIETPASERNNRAFRNKKAQCSRFSSTWFVLFTVGGVLWVTWSGLGWRTS